MKSLLPKISIAMSCLLLIVSFQNCAMPKLEAGDGNSHSLTTTTQEGCANGTDPLSGNCLTRLCDPGKDYGQVSCLSQVTNALAAYRNLTCAANGSNYVFGTCTIMTCVPGFIVQDNVCIVDPGPAPM